MSPFNSGSCSISEFLTMLLNDDRLNGSSFFTMDVDKLFLVTGAGVGVGGVLLLVLLKF
jgi:GTPase